MILHPPLIITARLMPGLQIGKAFISLNCGRVSRDGRTIYQVWIDLPDGSEHEITDLRSGCGGGGIQEGLGSLLSFLGAAAESHWYRAWKGESEIDPDGNEGLFSAVIVDWAAENADEISMLQCELEEGLIS